MNENFIAEINDLKIQLEKLAVIGHNETAGECICPNIYSPVITVDYISLRYIIIRTFSYF